MEGQIRLRWTSHQGTVISVFDALLSSESLVDVTLACEGRYIRAHKVILSACSPYFQDLISIDTAKHPIFFLKDVKYTELKALIQYMYRGDVNIANDDLPSLLAVAQALKIRGLADVETATNNISSDTIILPDLAKGRPSNQQQPPAPPIITVAPLPVPVLTVSTLNTNAPRSFPENSFTQNSVPPSPIVAPIPTSVPPSPIVAPIPTSVPPPSKKSRTETRSSIQAAAVQKQSQMMDPLLDVQCHPAVKSQFVDPLQVVSTTPTTSSHYDSLGQSRHSQDRDFGHRGMIEDTEPFDTGVMKLEANVPIEIDLEEENSMSQSSFSESWQMGDGDNSQMPDDDGELPGGSANNDGTGAEGGEGFDKHCHLCGKGFLMRQRWAYSNHMLYDCVEITPKFKCNFCEYTARRPDALRKHNTKKHTSPPSSG